jgi:hypothetical protein
MSYIFHIRNIFFIKRVVFKSRTPVVRPIRVQMAPIVTDFPDIFMSLIHLFNCFRGTTLKGFENSCFIVNIFFQWLRLTAILRQEVVRQT